MDRKTYIAIAFIAMIVILEIFLYQKYELNKRDIRTCYPTEQSITKPVKN
jgi:hypothetical protein